MAATLVGLRANNAVSQGRCLAPLILGEHRMTASPSHKQAAQIAIALLADTAEPVLALLERAGHEPDPGREIAPDRKDLGQQR